MKTISIFLALINALVAGLLITFLLSSPDLHQSALWWSALRVSIAASVILIGLLTWVDGMIGIHAGLMALGSIALVAIGAGTVVWTFHRAQLTGDMEYYMIIYGGSLFIQGATLLFGIPQSATNVTVM